MRKPSRILTLASMPLLFAGLAAVASGQVDDGLAKRLERHPFFSRITYERVESGRFIYLVQRPSKEDPAYVNRVIAEHQAWIDPAFRTFLQRYVAPFGLQPRSSRHVVAILASGGDFETYVDVSEASWHLDVHATIDPVFGGAVVHEAPFDTSRDPREKRRSTRHALAHVLQNAYFGGARGAPSTGWLLEGTADHFARLNDEGDSPGVDRGMLKEFVAACCETDARWANLHPLEELVTIGHAGRLYSYLRVEAKRNRYAEPDLERAWVAFQRQAALLVTFLQEGDDNAHAAQFERLLRGVLVGDTQLAALADAFALEELAEVDAAFLAWLAREHQRLWPDVPFDLTALLGAPAEAGVAAERVVLPALRLDDAAPVERLALALSELEHGRCAAGLAALEALEQAELDASLAARVRRELTRASDWIRLRDAFLERLLSEGESLQFELDGKRKRANIAAIEGGVLELEPNRSGTTRLEIEGFDPKVLAQQMSKRVDDLAADHVRVYPYALQGDAKWKKLLKGDDQAAEGLRVDADEDAEHGYPALGRIARAAALLEAVAAAGALPGPAEAELELARIEELASEYADVDLVDRRRAAIRARAQLVAEALFELQEPWKGFAGELEELGGGRVAITYDFSDPAQLLDFERSDYLATHGRNFGTLAAEDNDLFVADGVLNGIGSACLRSLVDLAAPLTVTYSLSFEDVEGLELPTWYMSVGICDDGAGHFAWALNIDFLEVWDPSGPLQALPDEQSALYMNERYELELRHDGSSITVSCAGDEKQTLPGRSLRDGAVFLWSYTDFPVRVDDLRIEGALKQGSFDRLKREWVQRRLADL